MSWPAPTAAHVAFYRERGWLVVPDAVDPDTLDALRARVRRVADDPVNLAFDPRRVDPAAAAVLQSTMELVWLDWRESALHAWTRAFAAALAGAPVSFWYNQLFLKPPRGGAATPWHQDEAYYGAPGPDLLVSCWMALDDVDADSGCMHFLDRGHHGGIRPEFGLAGGAVVAPSAVVACPLRAGGVTFHHGKTPHMTRPNASDRWRHAFIQRFAIDGVPLPTGHG